jgi:hypothetical protein
MILRFALLLGFAAGAVLAQCDCTDIGARESKRGAEIVFRGTVSEFHDSAKGERVAVFLVSRVWKGPVSAKFEMLAIETTCIGFYPGMLKLGNELLVFGHIFGDETRRDHPDYPFLSVPCATKLITKAQDIGQLGRGRKPKSK